MFLDVSFIIPWALFVYSPCGSLLEPCKILAAMAAEKIEELGYLH